ncbi:dipeptide ABC transporter ATP-binding protein [Clostridium sp. 'deep sea']|uniref:ABC transporter ATP-binding protein n=1 Tax=Clostridium sp. 'deep sea' TaxID=2779445 RepID=UPI0018969432|nr:dipeptide ABC transporter ATP-binding protein [Clostridium sp. 'deep sea']QOR34376.1 dipeptide ABC transporter ATP-binding protein [Clostridium sp. 'deep sea']
MSSNTLLEVKKLYKYFPQGKNWFKKNTSFVKAVDGVSFHVNKGETLGVVGESGCGKSTLARTILRLHKATGGEVKYKNTNIAKLTNKEMRQYRQHMQIIFQDPYSSLNPRLTVEQIIKEPLDIHHWKTKNERSQRVKQLIEIVGLTTRHLKRYPHEFSGGQRQRIGIARALALQPELVICDEPVSALDVSIQSQILNLLRKLQIEYKLTYIFIAHDLSVVKHISNRVAVMYLGKIVEIAAAKQLYNKPTHPYTQALLSAIPEPDPDLKKQRILLKGDVPSPCNPPSGCRFHTRCMHCMDICKMQEPATVEIAKNHFVSCHLIT